MATVSVNLDTTQYVQVNVGFNPMILQANRDSVRIVLNDTKPSRSNSVFHTLDATDEILPIHWLDTNMWVLAVTEDSSLIVTEVEPRDIDVSGAKIAISYEHSKVHDGQFFSAGVIDLAVADDGVIEMLYTTPVAHSIHMYIKLIAGGDAVFGAFEDAVATHGTSIASVNHDRTSTNTCGCTISSAPAITSDGDQLWAELVPGGTGSGSGGASATPGAVQGVSTEQVILAPDSTYLFRLQNIAGVTDPLQVMMAYYPVPA